MKIFVLTSRFPYPLEKGDKLRIYHQIRHLSQRHDIVLCALSESPVSQKDIDQVKPFCKEIVVLRMSRFFAFFRASLSFLFGGSLQVSYFYSRIKAARIRKLVFKHKPDHIYCQLIRMAEYVKDINHVSKTIDYMDAFSIGMERRAGDSPFPMNVVFRREACRLRDYESQVLYDFDLATIISEQDREFIKTPTPEKIRIIRNGVDTETFGFRSGQEGKHIDALFVGNMSYYPNVKAAEYLAENIVDEMRAIKGDFQLTIAGANPAPHLQRISKSGLEVLGWVDDIVAIYQSSRVFVAPLFHGSGLQNKILEAMACGVPVITTTQTNNAINAEPGTEILLADDAAEFVRHLYHLLNDDEVYRRLQENARRFVVENYSWESFVNQLDQFILET